MRFAEQNAVVTQADAVEHRDLQVEFVERLAEPLAQFLLGQCDEPTGDSAL